MNYIDLFVCFFPFFRKSPLISSQDFYPSAEVYLSALSRLVLTTLAIVIWIASLQDTQFAYIPNELANTISPYFQVSVKQTNNTKKLEYLQQTCHFKKEKIFDN